MFILYLWLPKLKDNTLFYDIKYDFVNKMFVKDSLAYYKVAWADPEGVTGNPESLENHKWL